MVSLTILLVIVGASVLAGGRALRASNETAAAQSVTSLAGAENTFSHEWGGYSTVATNLGGSELAATTAATFNADQEISTTQASKLDTGYVNGNYSFVYKSGGTTFTDDAGNQVASSFEFTGIPVGSNSGTRAECSDPSGTWSNTLGTGATPASGAGCKTDGYVSQ